MSKTFIKSQHDRKDLPGYRNQREQFYSNERRTTVGFWLSLVSTAILILASLPDKAGAAKIYGPNDFEPVCLSWYDHTAHLADSDASCNSKTGYVGTYANAWVGAGTAEAQQKIIVSVPDPDNTSRTICVDVEIWRAGGAKTYGYGGFAGTEKTWAVGTRDNYHRRDVDEWLTYGSAIGKLLDILLLGSGGGPEILGKMSDCKTGFDLGLLFLALSSTGNTETLHITFDYEVPAGVTTVSIWAGLRSTASACLTGWGDAISVGQVRSFTVYNVDPPSPPLVAGPTRAVGGESVQFSFTNPPGSGEFLKCWIDWDDTTPVAPELTGWLDPDQTVEVNHIYDEPGQYTIKVKAIAGDGSSSSYVTHHISVCPVAPTTVSASNGDFTDRVRVTWNSVSDANEYRLYRAASPNAPRTALGDWQKETVYDDRYNKTATAYNYWVQSRKDRMLLSEYSLPSNAGWSSILAPDLNDDGSIDMADVALIFNYWLESGTNISNDITQEDELVNMRHFALVSWAMGGEAPPDLVADGSFEVDDDMDGYPDHWNESSDPSCQGMAQQDNTTSLAGSASLMVQPCSGDAYCEQPLIIDPDTVYTLSGWMKTADVNGPGLFIAYERQIGQEWIVVAGTADNSVNGTTGWLQRTVTFTSPGDITNGRVVCNFGSMDSGIGWFDCIRLEPSDSTPPTVPQSLQVTYVTNETVSLSWDASTDDWSGIAGYNIFCDGYLLGSTSRTNYEDSGLNRSTTYSYTVSAFDKHENHSAQSSPVLAETDPGHNLLLNGSFESALLGWTNYFGATCDTTTPARHGTASMQVIPSGQFCFAMQELDVLGRTWYTLSAWIKANEAYGSPSPLFLAYEEWINDKWSMRAHTINDPVPSTTDWVQRSVTFRTSSGSEIGRVALWWLITFGQAWFDEIKLTVAE